MAVIDDQAVAIGAAGFAIGVVFTLVLVIVFVPDGAAGTRVSEINKAKIVCEEALPRNQKCELDVQFKIVPNKED